MDNKSLSHTKWKCQYHIVFIPKYRKKVLFGQLRQDVREILDTLCKYKDVVFWSSKVVMAAHPFMLPLPEVSRRCESEASGCYTSRRHRL